MTCLGILSPTDIGEIAKAHVKVLRIAVGAVLENSGDDNMGYEISIRSSDPQNVKEKTRESEDISRF